MNSSYRKKPLRGRNPRFNNDSKNNYRSQDNYQFDRRSLTDTTLYNIARFFMGNEIQVLTRSDKIEGVLRVFDSFSVWLSKVIVYDITMIENISFVKDLMDHKEVLWRDILMIKTLCSNGKTDSVLVDQEISQRKQNIKTLTTNDKNFVPYFDDDEAQLDEDKDDDGLNITMKGDQCCWYHPEDMMKVNEERFNVKSTFKDSMEDYTTKIDTTDPLLQQKYERAEKLAREMENDNSLRRVRQLEDDEEEHDEERRFSAVLPCVSSSTVISQETPVALASTTHVKLNPNAPEFRPRPKEFNDQAEELQISVISLMSDSIQQQQQHQQQQQQQQFIQRMTLQYPMGQQTPIQASMGPSPSQTQGQPPQGYPGGHRLVSTNPQWPLPVQGPSPGQYMFQPYIQQGQLMPSVFQTRQQEPGPTAGLFYSLNGQAFFVQQDPQAMAGLGMMGSGQMQGDTIQHIYGQSLDGQVGHHHHQVALAASSQGQPLRHPHIVPTNISLIQGAQGGHVSLGGVPGAPALSQASAPPAPPPSLQSQQSVGGQAQHQTQPPSAPSQHNYYTQPSPHPAIMTAHTLNAAAAAGPHHNYTQLLFNPQAQMPSATAAAIQSYISNGRP